MVYMGNIIRMFENLQDDEIMRITFTSSKEIRYIRNTDSFEKQNGDLIYKRENQLGRCIIVLDPAEVESACIITENIVKKIEGDAE